VGIYAPQRLSGGHYPPNQPWTRSCGKPSKVWEGRM